MYNQAMKRRRAYLRLMSSGMTNLFTAQEKHEGDKVTEHLVSSLRKSRIYLAVDSDEESIQSVVR